MQNAPLVSLSRQIALQNQMDVVANNLANINTAGYKAENILFEEYMMPGAQDQSLPTGDQGIYYTQDWGTIHDLKPGAFKQTGNRLDVALNGPGFLSVQTPNGVRYTRNGALHLNNQGTLVTADNYPVLSDAGPVSFSPDETDITFGRDGSIISSAGTKGRLQIAEFANPAALTRDGDTLFAPATGQTPTGTTTTKVEQGALEQSNVSGVTEMTSMIQVTRSYELMNQIISKQDELQQAAIQKLGNLSA